MPAYFQDGPDRADGSVWTQTATRPDVNLRLAELKEIQPDSDLEAIEAEVGLRARLLQAEVWRRRGRLGRRVLGQRPGGRARGPRAAEVQTAAEASDGG